MKLFLLSLMTFAVLAAQTEPPPLETVLSVNGRDEAAIQPGEPLILTAAFLSSEQTQDRAAAAALTLWTPEGKMMEATLQEREPSLSRMGDLEMARRIWTVAPEFTANLAPGTYLAWLEPEGQPAEQAYFQVESSIPAEDMDHQAMQHLILSRWLELEGRLEEAAAQADALIALQPDNLAARIRKADTLTSAGRLEEALSVLDDAEKHYYLLHPDGAHPPLLILKRQDSLLNDLGRGDVTLDEVFMLKP